MDLEMNTETILFNKNNLIITRKDYNHYSFEFIIENNNIDLPKIIDFNIVKLIHSLNIDIHEKVNLEIKDDNNATITIIIKNFFEDVGLPQYFIHVDVTKNIEDDFILFEAQTNNTRPEDIPQYITQMSIQKLTTKCSIITNHKISFCSNIIFHNKFKAAIFVEKMASLILNKIIKRVKQFIENLTL